MRRILLVCLCLSALVAMPAPAHAKPTTATQLLATMAQPRAHVAQCSCTRSWANRFVNDGTALLHYQQVWNNQNWSPYSWDWIIWRRNRTYQGVYDWAKQGDFDNGGLCANHPKVCKAIAACVTAGFITYGTATAGGASPAAADWAAAGACATAAHAAIMG